MAVGFDVFFLGNHAGPLVSTHACRQDYFRVIACQIRPRVESDWRRDSSQSQQYTWHAQADSDSARDCAGRARRQATRRIQKAMPVWHSGLKSPTISTLALFQRPSEGDGKCDFRVTAAPARARRRRRQKLSSLKPELAGPGCRAGPRWPRRLFKFKP